MKPLSRRAAFRKTTWLGGSVAAALPLAAAPVAESTRIRPKIKVVVTGGHPGDPEYGCGGTIARYADLGHEVALLYLNKGDPAAKSDGEASGVRVAEAAKACELLKSRPLYVGQIDGHAIVDPAHYESFRRLLESEKPNVVFTHWPIDNHADHRAMAMLVHDAWLKLGRGFALYYYEVSNGEDTLQFAPTHHVDISAVEHRKRAACFAHATQSPERYYAVQDAVARMRGMELGCRQAEGFVRLTQSPDFGLPGVGI